MNENGKKWAVVTGTAASVPETPVKPGSYDAGKQALGFGVPEAQINDKGKDIVVKNCGNMSVEQLTQAVLQAGTEAELLDSQGGTK